MICRSDNRLSADNTPYTTSERKRRSVKCVLVNMARDRKKWLVVAAALIILVFLAEVAIHPGNLVTDNSSAGQRQICYIIMEHPNAVKTQQKTFNRNKMRFEELSGLPCLVIHFTQIKSATLREYNIQAILISGISAASSRYKYNQTWFKEFFAFLREENVPTIGFCAGHQIIAQAYGGKIGSMRRLQLGEKDPNPNYHPGLYKEWGFKRVRIMKQDPLFDRLGNEIVVAEYHYNEVKRVPNKFDVLATTNECQIQAMKYKEKILYGTQFHPEAYDEKHTDGRIILENFFQIAGISTSGRNRFLFTAPFSDTMRVAAQDKQDIGSSFLIECVTHVGSKVAVPGLKKMIFNSNVSHL